VAQPPDQIAEERPKRAAANRRKKAQEESGETADKTSKKQKKPKQDKPVDFYPKIFDSLHDARLTIALTSGKGREEFLFADRENHQPTLYDPNALLCVDVLWCIFRNEIPLSHRTDIDHYPESLCWREIRPVVWENLNQTPGVAFYEKADGTYNFDRDTMNLLCQTIVSAHLSRGLTAEESQNLNHLKKVLDCFTQKTLAQIENQSTNTGVSLKALHGFPKMCTDYASNFKPGKASEKSNALKRVQAVMNVFPFTETHYNTHHVIGQKIEIVFKMLEKRHTEQEITKTINVAEVNFLDFLQTFNCDAEYYQKRSQQLAIVESDASTRRKTEDDATAKEGPSSFEGRTILTVNALCNLILDEKFKEIMAMYTTKENPDDRNAYQRTLSAQKAIKKGIIDFFLGKTKKIDVTIDLRRITKNIQTEINEICLDFCGTGEWTILQNPAAKTATLVKLFQYLVCASISSSFWEKFPKVTNERMDVRNMDFSWDITIAPRETYVFLDRISLDQYKTCYDELFTNFKKALSYFGNFLFVINNTHVSKELYEECIESSGKVLKGMAQHANNHEIIIRDFLYLVYRYCTNNKYTMKQFWEKIELTDEKSKITYVKPYEVVELIDDDPVAAPLIDNDETMAAEEEDMDIDVGGAAALPPPPPPPSAAATGGATTSLPPPSAAAIEDGSESPPNSPVVGPLGDVRQREAFDPPRLHPTVLVPDSQPMERRYTNRREVLVNTTMVRTWGEHIDKHRIYSREINNNTFGFPVDLILDPKPQKAKKGGTTSFSDSDKIKVTEVLKYYLYTLLHTAFDKQTTQQMASVIDDAIVVMQTKFVWEEITCTPAQIHSCNGLSPRENINIGHHIMQSSLFDVETDEPLCEAYDLSVKNDIPMDTLFGIMTVVEMITINAQKTLPLKWTPNEVKKVVEMEIQARLALPPPQRSTTAARATARAYRGSRWSDAPPAAPATAPAAPPAAAPNETEEGEVP
jgi:hypothetical protein